jgi:hypothetical protein
MAGGCREQHFEGFVKIGDNTFISDQHRTEDAVQPDGTMTQLINLKYINSLAAGEASEIYEIEFYCKTGAFRIMGGARYSDPALEGSRIIVEQESPSRIRQAPAGSAVETVIAYARNSAAICKKV